MLKDSMRTGNVVCFRASWARGLVKLVLPKRTAQENAEESAVWTANDSGAASGWHEDGGRGLSKGAVSGTGRRRRSAT